MEPCTMLWAALGGIAVLGSNLISWLLDNWPTLNAWWFRLPNAFKVFSYALVTVILGAGLWAIGRFVLPCPDWPADATIWTMILAAALSFFSGAFRHERDKA